MINYSGIGTYIKNLLPGIINCGEFTVTVLGVEEELKKFAWFESVQFIALRSKPLSLFEHVELPLKIPFSDIYWAPNVNTPLFPVRARTRITTIHDVNHLANAKKHSKSKIAFIKTLIKAAINYSTFIVTVSDFSKREIIRYGSCPSSKIKVFPLAVADTYNAGFTPQKINDKYILFVGNVKPGKNVENALLAFREITDKSIKFYIVGKKEGFITGYSNLSSLFVGLEDRVIFTGYVTDEELKNYYYNAKAFIFPSTYEGFGLPVLEAMKFNIPVIASNAASIPEAGGEAILYFDPNNVSEITEKMEMAMKDGFVIDKAKYEQHLSRFSWLKTTRQHVQLFKSVVNKI